MTRVPCPNCGGWETEFVDTRAINGMVSVMCWNPCGMDFDINGISFMIVREEE